MAQLYLIIAIIAEVAGTLALKQIQGFRNLVPTLVVIVAYGTSFYFFSRTLEFLPVGVVYAIWSGLGLVLVILFSALVYKQSLDLPGLMGILLIIAGIIIIRLFSAMRLD